METQAVYAFLDLAFLERVPYKMKHQHVDIFRSLCQRYGAIVAMPNSFKPI
uniref:Uncharacterized protein n=1 Tax=Arundo donax TaxID=35708 RepID=A0A0A9H0J2_ARUDO